MNSETQILEPLPGSTLSHTLSPTLLAAPQSDVAGLAAPTCRAEASERRRKSDVGGSPTSPVAPKQSEGGSTYPEPAHPAVGKGHRGNGFVARRPKVVRDQINNMILDGVSYPDIIARLGEAGHGLKPNHIYEWKKHGYQTWLIEREWLEKISSKTEFSADILATPDSSGLHEAGLRIAASQMFDQLMLFDAANQASDGSTNHAEKFARLVNALSRLTREALSFQKYRDTTAAKLAQRDPDRELPDHEHEAWADRVDLMFKRPRRSRVVAGSGDGKRSSLAAPTCPDIASSRRGKSDVGGSGPTLSHTLSHTSPADSPIENQKSKIKNAPALRSASDEGGSASPPQDSGLRTQHSPPPTLDFRPKFLDSASPSQLSTPLPRQSVASAGKPSTRSKELCHECRAPLPPLLPTGERPSIHCRKCGAALRPFGTLVEHCPKCRCALPELTPTGARPTPRCPQCQSVLPPPPNLEPATASP